MDAVDGIRSAGVSQLGLLTERTDDSGTTTTTKK
jgi:biopolymer transport protein TolR